MSFEHAYRAMAAAFENRQSSDPHAAYTHNFVSQTGRTRLATMRRGPIPSPAPQPRKNRPEYSLAVQIFEPGPDAGNGHPLFEVANVWFNLGAVAMATLDEEPKHPYTATIVLRADAVHQGVQERGLSLFIAAETLGLQAVETLSEHWPHHPITKPGVKITALYNSARNRHDLRFSDPELVAQTVGRLLDWSELSNYQSPLEPQPPIDS